MPYVFFIFSNINIAVSSDVDAFGSGKLTTLPTYLAKVSDKVTLLSKHLYTKISAINHIQISIGADGSVTGQIQFTICISAPGNGT